METDVWRDSPYKGLTHYEEQDAQFFFGREKETKLIEASLFASPLTLLYGASGVGKSSVLHAGVLRSLRSQQDVVAILFNQWQGDPLWELKMAVARAASPLLSTGEHSLPAGDEATKQAVSDINKFAVQRRATAGAGEGARSHTGDDIPLDEYLKACSALLGDRRLMIILDQFEEYSLYHPDDDALAAELPRAVAVRDLSVSFLLSLREDGLARLDRFKGSIPILFNNYRRIDHLDRASATDAIKKPIELFNKLYGTDGRHISIKSVLVEEILNQVRTGQVHVGDVGRGRAAVKAEAGKNVGRVETPYLQLILTRLWKEERRVGSDTLRLETLTKLGGAKRIVRTHLDNAMETLKPEEQDTAASLFNYLVTPSGTKFAQSPRDLSLFTSLPRKEINSLVEKLSSGDMRILRPVAVSDDPPSQLRYEIFHDVLAGAILDWRVRHIQARDRAAAEAYLKHEWRRELRVWLSIVVFLSLLVASIAYGISVYTSVGRARDLAKIAHASELTVNAQNSLERDPTLSMHLASAAISKLQQVEGRDTRDILYETTKVLRDALLAALNRYHLVARLTGHTERRIYSAVFSPNGRFVVTAGEDGTARVWDAATGRHLAQFRGHTGAVLRAFVSPDGRSVLTAGTDGTACIWRLETGELKLRLTGHADTVNSAAFSPDGQLVVTASFDRTGRIWEAATGRVLHVLKGHEGWLVSASFSPDGKYVLTSSVDTTARLWDARTGQQLSVLSGHRGVVYNAVFSPDGTLIATGSADRTGRLWETSGGRNTAILEEHREEVNRITFSPDGRFVVTASKDDTARIWEAATGKYLRELSHIELGLQGGVISRDVNRAVFSPDGKLIATASDDHLVVIWDAETGKRIETLAGHAEGVSDLAFSSNGNYLVSAGYDRLARVWKVASEYRDDYGQGSPVRKLILNSGAVSFPLKKSEWQTDPDTGKHADSVRRLACSPDGRFIVTASKDTTARVWNLNSRTTVALLRGHESWVNGATFSPDGKFVATASEDGTARVWDALTGRQLHKFDVSSTGVHDAVFSPDGKHLAAGGSAVVSVWDVATGESRAVLRGHQEPLADIAYSPDGKLIAAASLNGGLRVWNANKSDDGWALVSTSGNASGTVFSVDFSHDGQRIVSADADSLARVWDLSTRRNTVTLRGHQNWVTSAQFSPDGKLILTASRDNTLRIWEWESASGINTPSIINQSFGTLNGSAIFSPDGRSIISFDDNGWAQIYPWESFAALPNLLDAVNARAAYPLTPAQEEKYLHKSLYE